MGTPIHVRVLPANPPRARLALSKRSHYTGYATRLHSLDATTAKKSSALLHYINPPTPPPPKTRCACDISAQARSTRKSQPSRNGRKGHHKRQRLWILTCTNMQDVVRFTPPTVISFLVDMGRLAGSSESWHLHRLRKQYGRWFCFFGATDVLRLFVRGR